MFANWAALPTNDCDADGVTVAGGDLDDFDACIDASGASPSCSGGGGGGATSGPSQWSITGTPASINEGSCATYTVAMSAPVDSVATVDLGITDNTTSPSDYDNLNTAVAAAVAAYAGSGTLTWDGVTLTFTGNGTAAMSPLQFSLCATTDGSSESNETYTVELSNPTVLECVKPELLVRARINGSNDATTMRHIRNVVTDFGSNGTSTTWIDQGLAVYSYSGGVLTNTTGQNSQQTYSSNRLPAGEDGFVEFQLSSPIPALNQLEVGLAVAQYPVNDLIMYDFNNANVGVTGWRTIGQMAGFVGVAAPGQTSGASAWMLGEASSDVWRLAREGCDMNWYLNGALIRTLTRASTSTAGAIDPTADAVTTEIVDQVVDTDGDGILDSNENPGEENDPCLDPANAAWVALPTNDCDGDGSTVADGDTNDADPCAQPGDTNWVALPTNAPTATPPTPIPASTPPSPIGSHSQATTATVTA